MADSMERVLSILLTTDASILYGYTNALDSLTLTAQVHSFHQAIPFVAVQTIAEILTAQTRQAIENVLGPVHDAYGCGQILRIAIQ